MTKPKSGLAQTSDHFKRIHFKAKIKQYGFKIPFIWLFNSVEDLLYRSLQLLILFVIVDYISGSIGFGDVIPLSEYDRLMIGIILAIPALNLAFFVLKRIMSTSKRSIEIADCMDCSQTGMRTNGICRTCNGIGVVNHSRGL
tara:strand:- start:712 stop:1137 length:426 start_codon:yes stop_codon:yes gene_type:complete